MSSNADTKIFRLADKPFYMRTSCVVEIRGIGKIVIGQINKGTLKLGQKVKFSITGYTGKVVAIEMNHIQVEQAGPVDKIGAVISGLGKDCMPIKGELMFSDNDDLVVNDSDSVICSVTDSITTDSIMASPDVIDTKSVSILVKSAIVKMDEEYKGDSIIGTDQMRFPIDAKYKVVDARAKVPDGILGFIGDKMFLLGDHTYQHDFCLGKWELALEKDMPMSMIIELPNIATPIVSTDATTSVKVSTTVAATSSTIVDTLTPSADAVSSTVPSTETKKIELPCTTLASCKMIMLKDQCIELVLPKDTVVTEYNQSAINPITVKLVEESVFKLCRQYTSDKHFTRFSLTYLTDCSNKCMESNMNINGKIDPNKINIFTGQSFCDKYFCSDVGSQPAFLKTNRFIGSLIDIENPSDYPGDKYRIENPFNTSMFIPDLAMFSGNYLSSERAMFVTGDATKLGLVVSDKQYCVHKHVVVGVPENTTLRKYTKHQVVVGDNKDNKVEYYETVEKAIKTDCIEYFKPHTSVVLTEGFVVSIPGHLVGTLMRDYSVSYF